MNSLFREWLVYIIIAIVLSVSIWNNYRSDLEHHAFFDDVRGFISVGPRNTAMDGYILCERINRLVAQSTECHLEQMDCKQHYGLHTVEDELADVITEGKVHE